MTIWWVCVCVFVSRLMSIENYMFLVCEQKEEKKKWNENTECENGSFFFTISVLNVSHSRCKPKCYYYIFYARRRLKLLAELTDNWRTTCEWHIYRKCAHNAKPIKHMDDGRWHETRDQIQIMVANGAAPFNRKNILKLI